MRRFLALLTFLFCTLLTYGQEVTIGTPSANSRYPLGNHFGFERSAAVYTAAEINSSGLINKLAWNIGTLGSSRPIKIYLKEIETSTLTAANWDSYTQGATLVFDGVFNPTITGFNTFNFFTSFNYTGGTKNLLVLVEANHGSSGNGEGAGGLTVRAFSSVNQHFTANQDNSIPTGNLVAQSNKPQIKITFGDMILCPGFSTSSITQVTSSGFIIESAGRSGVTHAIYEVRTSGDFQSGVNGLVADGVRDLVNFPVLINGLTENTTYKVFLKPMCSIEPGSIIEHTVTTNSNGQIGSGTREDSNLPILSSWGYNYSQMIYTSSEVSAAIGTSRLITKIKFYTTASGSSPDNYNRWTVYMGNTNKTEFTGTVSTQWINHGSLQQTFSGTVDLTTTSNRWIEIELSSPFLWDGTSNLAIAVYEDKPGTSSGLKFRTYSTTANRGMMKYQDGAGLTPASATAGAASNRYTYLPQIVLNSITVPDCYQPVGVNATNINSTSFDLNWTFLDGTTNNGSEYYLSTTNTAPTEATLPTGTFGQGVVTGSVGSLTELTTYYVWMRTICTNGTKSNWSSVLVVNTPMSPAALPFTDNFEGTTNYIFTNDTTNKWVIGSAVNNGGTKSLYISNDNGVTNTYTTSGSQVSQVYKDFTVPASVSELRLQFDWRCVGELTTWDYFRVWAVPATFVPTAGVQISAGAGRVQLGGTFNGNPAFTAFDQTFDASSFAGQTMRLVFEWRNDSGSGDQPPAAIDNINISIIACSQPQNLRLGTATANSITANWNAVNGVASYDLYISTSPTTPGTGATLINVTGTTHTFTGLTDGTQYYIWVRSHCSDIDQSLWTGPLNAGTQLLPVALPFTENFEGTPKFAFTNDTTNKWVIGSAVNNGGAKSLYISNDNGVTNTYTTSGSQVSQVYKDFTVPASVSELRLQFDWRCIGEGTATRYDYFRVWAVPTTFTPVAGTQIGAAAGRVRLGGDFNQNSTFTAFDQTFDASSFAGQTMRLVFEWRNDSGSGTQPPAAIDNINISIIACSQPQNLRVGTATTNSITANWNAVNGVASYDVYISTSPTTPGAGATVVNVTGTTHTFTGLTDGTQYYIWVRSHCSDTEQSLWTGPIGANTVLLPVELPYSENFEGTPKFGFTNDTTNKWVVGEAVSNGGRKSLYISNDNGLSNIYTVSGQQVSHAYKDIIIPNQAIDLNLRFDWRCVGESSWDYFRVWLVPITYNTVAGVQIQAAASGGIQVFNNFNQNPVFLTQNSIVDIQQFAGQTVRLVFEWRNDNSGGNQPPAAIDNINISVSSCPRPTDIALVNLTPTTAEISWTDALGITEYDIFVNDTDVAPLSTTVPTYSGVTSPFTIPDLLPNTRYYVWVRSSCGPNNKSVWVGAYTFLMPQIPGELPFTDNFEGDFNWSFTQATNKWAIGAAVSNGGAMSLYVSTDGGRTHNYNITSTSVAHAYRDIAIPEDVNEITISYDYMVKGEVSGNTGIDYFRLVKVPVTTVPVGGNSIAANAIGNKLIGRTFYAQSPGWQRETVALNVSEHRGQTIRLVFEWINNFSAGNQPPAAIDNVNIVASRCPSVTNPIATIVRYTQNVRLSWTPQGTETKWEVYTTNQGDPAPALGTPGVIVEGEPTLLLESVPPAEYFVYYVRAVCEDERGENKSPWVGPQPYSYFVPEACADVDGGVVGMPVAEDNNYVICETGPVTKTLDASYYDAKRTDSYRVESIPYNPPFPFFGGDAIEINRDDIWSDIIELGFDFCFYGTQYDKIIINTNGIISFSIAGAVPGGRYTPNDTGSPWNPAGQVPSFQTGSSGPTAASIFGVFQDTDPSNSPASRSINYQILGTFPCRALVFNMYELGMWSCGYDPNDIDGTTQTSQIVLYEGTNIIEVHVKNRSNHCERWNGNGIIGLQNEDSTQGITPPGRNAGRWSASNESWRFIPDGESSVNFQWLKDGEFYSNDPLIDVVVTESVNYTAQAVYHACDGNELVVDRVFNFLKEDFDVSELPNYYVCGSFDDPGNKVDIDISQNKDIIFESLGENSRTNYTIEYFKDAALTQDIEDVISVGISQTVYVRVTNLTTECAKVGTFEAVRVQPIVVTKLGNVEVCSSYTLPMLAEGEVYYSQSQGKGTMYQGGDVLDEIGVTELFIYKEGDHGCYGESSFKVQIHEFLPVDLFDDVLMQCEVYVLPELSRGNKYYTEPNEGGIELKPGQEIIMPMRIYVFARSGSKAVPCIEESSFMVDYEDCPIPKGISPNGDGINDTLDLTGYGISKIQIYNRNGAEVYAHGLDYTNQWRGQDKSGKLLPSGTYYYVLVSNGKVRTGWVQLNY